MSGNNLTTVECNGCGTEFEVVGEMLDDDETAWCSTECRENTYDS